MITISNYYEVIAGIDRKKLDVELRNAADFVDEVSEKGKDWSAYLDEDVIRRTIDEYFAQLSAFIGTQKKTAPKGKVQPESEIVDNYAKKTESRARKSSTSSQSHEIPGRARSKSLRVIKRPGQPVELISEELRFIKRYTLLHGKLKNRDQIRLFINALQRAMTEKRIRKTSPYAKEILYIQDSLMELYSKFRSTETIQVTLNATRLNQLLAMVGKQELMLSVKFIKSYIGLQGKRITNKQASSLHNRITKAIDDERITEKDPYWNEITGIHTNLKTFVKKNTGEGILVISERELNGLQGIAGFGEIYGLNGITAAPRNVRMNSMDFVQMKFDKIGFTRIWLDFFGNPSRGFSVLVSGPPKFGKSILCTGFAGYLARNHGKVLYVAKEEGLDDTLREKLDEVAHSNLEVQDYFDGDVEGFDFVFLDSITRLQMSPDDLNNLRAVNPGISFIFIAQVTKSGKARGSNEFAHDVDCIIEFPEIGKAVQYGRFNQGGAMQLFNNQ